MKKVAVFAIVIMATHSCFGKGALPSFSRKLHTGLIAGVNYALMYPGDNEPLKARKLSTVNGLGYRLGLVAELPITSRLCVSAKPELAFNDNTLSFVNADKETHAFKMPPTCELAVHFSYGLSRRTSHPYLFTGTAYKFPLVGETSTFVHYISRPLACIDAGAGFQRSFRHFTLAPEIRYSFNVNKLSNISGIDDLRMHVLSVSVVVKK